MCFAEWAPADPTVRTGRSPRRTKRRIIYKEFIFLNATSPETKSRPGVTGLACGCQQAMTKQKANPHVHVHFLGEALCIYKKKVRETNTQTQGQEQSRKGVCAWRAFGGQPFCSFLPSLVLLFQCRAGFQGTARAYYPSEGWPLPETSAGKQEIRARLCSRPDNAVMATK